MATAAVLRPHDHLHRPPRNPNPGSFPRRRKRSPSAGKSPSKALLIGPVKILRRGEDLTPTTEAPVLCSTDRLGPDPEKLSEQIGVYAGSPVFSSSPPPSSLPIPAFFADREKNEAATCDIRRLLGLDSVLRL